MIQRIQTIFLLVCSASFFSLFGLPFATSSIAIPQLFSDMTYDINDSPILMALCILGGIISLSAIFLFNNRALQLKMSYVTTVLCILLPLVVVLLVYNEGTTTTQTEKIDDNIGIYLPLIGLIFSVLSSRYIKKDDNIVKSMDRLR